MGDKLFDPASFGTALRVEMARRRLHMRSAAEEIGISRATVCRVCSEKPPDVETYLRINQWLTARAALGEPK